MGADVLKRLIATADVFVQNFRTGVIDRMGFGEDAVRAIAPDIIYVSISGFGEQGPFAAKPVYDPLIQALFRAWRAFRAAPTRNARAWSAPSCPTS